MLRMSSGQSGHILSLLCAQQRKAAQTSPLDSNKYPLIKSFDNDLHSSWKSVRKRDFVASSVQEERSMVLLHFPEETSWTL